jgi:multiple sugar transport system substrate-binding protein
MKKRCALFILLFIFTTAGCGRPGGNGDSAGGASRFSPINPDAIVFWDRQTQESAALLKNIVAEFNQSHPGPPIAVEKAGNYGDIFRKVAASIQARKLPGLAVSYPSMTIEYLQAGAVACIDPFLDDPEIGLTPEERADFYPGVIENSTFSGQEGRMYSFPFAKSVLVMFFNRRLLTEAGIDKPPATWDRFIEQCRRIKSRTGKYAHAVAADCSTINAIIYSLGGEVLQDGKTCYDSPEALRAFEIYETLIREELAWQVTPGTWDDNVALVNNQIAFTLRTSSSRDAIARMMTDQEAWGIAPIPQGDPANPATVLFGPDITIFNTTLEQQRRAWAFVRYFTSKDTAVHWTLGTGYVPIRKSVAADPRVQQFRGAWKYNGVPGDCLAFARPEPNVAGWQQVRDLVARAQTAVLTKIKTAEQAARGLKTAADAVLARQ